jgi:hypothetical protein
MVSIIILSQFAVWDFLTKNIQTINALILFFTLIAVIWYNWETRKLRISNEKTLKVLEENLNLEKAKNDPKIVAYFDNGATSYSILLVLSNEGGSMAKNVKMKSEPEFDFGDDVFNKFTKKSAVFNFGINIPPKGKYTIKVGTTRVASPLYKDGKIPTNYIINLTYKDMKGKDYTEYYELSIDQFFNRIVPVENTFIEEQLYQINESLKTIASTFNNIASNFNKSDND